MSPPYGSGYKVAEPAARRGVPECGGEGEPVIRSISLTAFLFAFWLALSGHYTVMLITIGVLCAILVTLVAARMRLIDAEGFPVHLLGRAVTYYPWLAWEIVKSGWTVTKLVLHPRLPISPTMTVVRASQRTSAARATYANSITLTPGTITVGVSGADFTVHALTQEGAIDVEGGGMDQRVSRFEGGA